MIPIILAALYLAPGHVWVPNWNDSHARTLYLYDYDPNENPTKVQFSGSGSASIDGHGAMTLHGAAPRYRILEHFLNTNTTVYAKRISEEKALPYAGFELAARSHHFTDGPCFVDTYYGSLTYDGRAVIEKELVHGIGSNAFAPSQTSSKHQVHVFDNGIPFDKWIGIRFTVKNVAGGVLLQLYVDKNDDGNFVQVLEKLDDGNWPVNSDGQNCEGAPADSKIITEPGFTFIRNDGLGQAAYTNMSIVELPN